MFVVAKHLLTQFVDQLVEAQIDLNIAELTVSRFSQKDVAARFPWFQQSFQELLFTKRTKMHLNVNTLQMCSALSSPQPPVLRTDTAC